MKSQEPGSTFIFLFLLVVVIYLAPIVEDWFDSFSSNKGDIETIQEIPDWADFSNVEEDEDVKTEVDVQVDSINEVTPPHLVEAIKIKYDSRWKPDYDTCTIENIDASNRFIGNSDAFLRLYHFFERLDSIHFDDEEPLHIFHFGDSQIEGDRITGRLRSSWQKSWGGGGPGLIPAIQPIPSLAVRQEYEGNITRYTRFGRVDTSLGHQCYGPMAAMCVIIDSGKVNVRPHPMSFKKNRKWEKAEVLIGAAPMGGTLRVFGDVTDTITLDIPPSATESHQFIDIELSGVEEELFFEFEGHRIEVTGIRLGSSYGVQIHNIPMRGSSGTVFKRINQKHFSDFMLSWDVGMIILQYGGNTAPYILDSLSARRYGRKFGGQIKYLRKLMPEVSVIVIGPSDMGITADSTNLTYPMLGQIRNALRDATVAEGGLYWDLAAAMGGAGTMERWAVSKPKLAAPDLVHFTPKGAREIGKKLDKVFRAEYRSWILSNP